VEEAMLDARRKLVLHPFVNVVGHYEMKIRNGRDTKEAGTTHRFSRRVPWLDVITSE
jgi:hypothetical protein